MSVFFKEKIYPILFMAIITAVFIAMVASIHFFTLDVVKANENLFLRQSVLFAANIEVPEETGKLNDLYEKRIIEIKDNEDTILYFRVLSSSGSQTGYVVYSAGPGLWGEIIAVIGYEKDKKTLTGVNFIKQNETPGLGARIMEEWFRRQFTGKSGPFKLVPEGTADENSEMDAITGATRTSVFVKNIINNSRDIILGLEE